MITALFPFTSLRHSLTTRCSCLHPPVRSRLAPDQIPLYDTIILSRIDADRYIGARPSFTMCLNGFLITIPAKSLVHVHCDVVASWYFDAFRTRIPPIRVDAVTCWKLRSRRVTVSNSGVFLGPKLDWEILLFCIVASLLPHKILSKFVLPGGTVTH